MPTVAARAAAGERVAASLQAGLELYEGREFALAGRRFHEAAVAAASLRDTETARRATAAECLAWLRGRQLDRLAGCSARLERWQRTADRSDPGLNTLVALGAIAGQRPPPSLRLPPEVRALVRDAIR